jgi:hydrogenase maturation protein HypF
VPDVAVQPPLDVPRQVVDVQRLRLRVRGVVQGVGFRPYVFRLAESLGVAGFVQNDVDAVAIEIEGSAGSLATFTARLSRELPPLAECHTIEAEAIAILREDAFRILHSGATRDARTHPFALIAPDAATCDDCLRELFDPTDRRYRYPFINCTNCGPRFTIVEDVPYDRANTTMRAFTMCESCAAEYADPRDRRFHAQPNACARCGPSVTLSQSADAAFAALATASAVDSAAALLRAGAIVAVKGVGGYHLACLANDANAVARLRERKRRPDKPFAIMAASVEDAERFAVFSGAERALLVSRERPIVLVAARADAPVAANIAPRLRELGIMLPYSPLHHLLLRDAGAPLVMTSGNLSGEPLAYDDDDALRRLSSIADGFLVHDRPIARPVDDSVVRVIDEGESVRRLTVRRARGYTPAPMPLPGALDEPTLAVGGQLKNTYAFGAGRSAWIGPHLGDLDGLDTFAAFRAGIDGDARRLGVQVSAIVRDTHPEYQSSRYAEARAADEALSVKTVQHHHAHFAACLAEHNVNGDAVGVIFDGTGLGDAEQGGGVWGGELLVGNAAASRRVAHLWPVALPGGEAAIREPWRMACAWLVATDPALAERVPTALVGRVEQRRWQQVRRLCEREAGTSVAPWTTSVGRLFDAVAALAGIAPVTSYEGQAAIELEAVANERQSQQYEIPIAEDVTRRLVFDAREMMRRIVRDMSDGVPIAKISMAFHSGLAHAVATACQRMALPTVVLSGGAFQNALLLARTVECLRRSRCRVLVPERMPVNDGGIAYGQLAAIAAKQG